MHIPASHPFLCLREAVHRSIRLLPHMQVAHVRSIALAVTSQSPCKLVLTLSTGCEPAQLVSALNNEDQGTNNVGNVFTAGFPIDLVNAAWGYQNIDGAKIAAGIPSPGTGANPGSKECLAQCGLISGDAPNGTYSAPPSYSSA